jgi:Na+-driven multidrug efflux pump
MKTWLSQPVSRNLLGTSIYLVILSGLSVFILASIVSLTRIQETGNPIFIFLVMMVGASVGGGL